MPNLRAPLALTLLAVSVSGCAVQVMVARQGPPAPAPADDRPAPPADGRPEPSDVSRE